MPYSWKLSTTISNNEASENYKNVSDPAIMVCSYYLTPNFLAFYPRIKSLAAMSCTCYNLLGAIVQF